MIKRIHILGASGSGSMTLGRVKVVVSIDEYACRNKCPAEKP